MQMRQEYKTDVLLCREGDHYVAFGVDIDYVACGETEQEACENFSRGLKLSIELNIERYGTAERFCKPPPQSEIAEFGPDVVRYSETIIHG
jgi:hypothetical protein